MFKDNRTVQIKDKYDIIVVGGGVAGVSAALSAAILGKSTLLLEKGIMLGGLATAGLISWYEPLCDGFGHKMTGGNAEKLLRLAIEFGSDTLPNEWRTGCDNVSTNKRYSSFYSPTIFSLALDDLLLKNGVTIRLDTLATYPVMKDTHCKGIITESKSGKEFFEGKIIIDATGDASIFNAAGAPCEKGENFFTFIAHRANMDDINSEPLSIRKWASFGADCNGNGHPQYENKPSGTTGEEVTDFVLKGHKMLFDSIKNEHRKSRDITTLPTLPQFRTIRHIVGEYKLTGADLKNHFEDSIGTIVDFRNRGHCYEIPYGCLYNKNYNNMLAAGRIVSASDDGWEITRVIPAAVLTGQATGTAAAMCIEDSTGVKEINIPMLQRRLELDGVKIHF